VELDSIGWVEFGIFFVGSGLLAYLASRRIVPSVFDIWFVIPANQAIIIAYTTYAYWYGLIEPSHALFILVSLGAFAAGTYVVPEGPGASPPPMDPKTLPEHVRLLRYTLYALCVQQAIADIAFFAARGIPVLSEDGTNPTIYRGGFGIVKYLHDANFSGITALAFLLLLLARDRRSFAIGMAFVVYPLVLMEWGKASIIYLALLLYTMNRYCESRYGMSIRVPGRVAWAASVAGVAFVALRFTGVVASGYEDSVIGAIAKRIINSADSIVMYFQLGGHEYFKGEVGLLPYLASALTPYLGIRDASQTIRTELAQVTIGLTDDAYGPSPPYQVIGHLALGWGGIAYAFAVGAALALVKRATVGLRHAAPYFVLLAAVPFLAGDSSLVAYYLSCQIFNLPAFAAAYLLFHLLAPGEGEAPAEGQAAG
jgi:hypothetical protein